MIDLIHNSESFLIYLVGQAIKECVGANNCEVVFNLVPKVHAMSDIYCQLIPNDNEQDPYYQVMPRMGAFEVSVNGCVSKNSKEVSLTFSTGSNGYPLQTQNVKESSYKS